MTTSENFKEQRRFPRMPILSTKARLFNGDDVITTDAVQISEGGLLVSTTTPLEVSDEIYVHVTILKTYIRAKAKVNYVIKNPDDKQNPYSIGLAFTSLTDPHLEAIKRYSKIVPQYESSR